MVSSESEHEPTLPDMLRIYLEEHKPYLNPGFSVQDITSETGLPYYLINNFLSDHGINFAQMRLELRIKHAVGLMNDKTTRYLPLKEIAIRSGYRSRTNFFTHFKEVTGLTPTEYRCQR